MKQYTRLREALHGSVWFVHEPKMRQILAFLEMRINGSAADPAALARFRADNELRAARAQNVSASSSGAVAVIPIYGVISHRADMFSEYSGGASTEKLTQQIRQAVNDPNITAIVLDIDSPGGSTDGVDELATEIYNARKQKKIVAVSDSLCASAAYYLGAQATEFVASPSSLTGSIGVYCCHEDDSGLYEQLGVKFTLIKFGENKTEGNSLEPLSAAALQHLQEMVDSFGLMFEKAVARGRGVKVAEVHDKFGQGRIFTAPQSVKLGLADRVATLDDVLGQFGVKRTSVSGAAAAETPAPQANDDGDHVNCTCPCDACQADDCENCDCSGCDSEGCDALNCKCDQDAATDAQLAAVARGRLVDLLAA